MSYNTRENLYEIVQMNISQKRKDIIKIDSIKSFRVVTEKYFWLTLLYCWHSRIIWSNVNAQLQEGHCGGSSRQRRYWCVRRVWPMRWQLCHASKVQKWCGLANYSTHEQQQPERLVADGRVKCRRQSVPQKSHFYLLQATIED